ncbi:MAG: hypothetical protein AC479_05935 [miscellaneous Crenarchaeota group-6 archaeon AD8-1]|nr:MAG: hypothetical protein AC479_05935 [miscellaneous Crenarchaeota group-6 archaeon AD8-1]
MGKKNNSIVSNKKVLVDSGPSKQLRLDNLPSEELASGKEVLEQKRKISINNICLDLDFKRDELALKVDFSLLPSKVSFSKLKADLWFDNTKVKSVQFDILHTFGRTDDFSLRATLDFFGVKPGSHAVKVELYEVSSFRKNLAYAVKETTVEYNPPSKKERLKKVLAIQKVEGQGIAIVSENEKEIYKEIEDSIKETVAAKEDKW